MVEEGNGVKEDLANVSKTLQAAHSDNEELGNSLKLMRAREAENRRREVRNCEERSDELGMR